MKVLVRVPNWIGDAVISLGFLDALERAVDAEITLLALEKVSPIFEGRGRLVVFRSRRELFSISLKLRRVKFDIGFVLPPSLSSALSIALAAPSERIGYRGDWRSIFLTRALKKTRELKSEHLLMNYMRLLDAAGIKAEPSIPRFKFLPGERAKALKLFGELNIEPARSVAISPFAAFGPAKEWGIQKFVELSRRATERSLSVIVLGGPNDFERSSIFNDIRGCINLTGRLSIRETAAVLSHVPVLVSNDSGILHLGAASGTKVVGIYGSTSPIWTGPLGEGHIVIYKRLPCSPCFKRRCPRGTHECMEQIGVDEVLESVLKYFEKQ